MPSYLKKLLEMVGLDQSYLPALEKYAERAVDVLEKLFEHVEAEENPWGGTSEYDTDL
jgi:hypothetical protein